MQAHENDFIKIDYFPEQSLIHADWLRSVSSDEYREGVSLSLQFLKKYDPTYWLVDVRNLQGIRLSDQHWIQQEIVPQLIGLSVRKLARVGAADIFNYMSFEDMAEKAVEDNPISIDVAQFTSMEAAKSWLQLYED
jgi:hypothetical protein